MGVFLLVEDGVPDRCFRHGIGDVDSDDSSSELAYITAPEISVVDDKNGATRFHRWPL